ncbi:N-acetylmuramoyl-L-alanine amidase [Shouchella miscanthi]|uniref:N-acetylmuramoyl-L-alanine amidase n=1 Tax=Shouchella miscanthi TaxID=2598861 RepID=A0ABU6NLA2_9BACI|nr:N-acetylmuramoyl-L-alanine amidase [Shouchella miscanthi]MED4128855.1 N-acetylmuramoyl-L-alanine amidase [Shouchella miscanthi]
MELKQDFIPQSNSNRPQTALRPTHITVHETANTSNGANAEMHARYVKGADAQARQVSWHVTVDDTQAIQHLPFNEVGWHAGANGNRQSIGIEICVNRDGNFPQARANAISLVRRLMNELSIGINSVVTHQHWTGKNCPANLLPSWNQFIADVRAGTSPEPAPPMEGRLLRVIVDSLWVYNRPDWNARYTTVSRNEVFTIAEQLTVNGSRMYRLKSGLYITANPSYVQLI